MSPRLFSALSVSMLAHVLIAAGYFWPAVTASDQKKTSLFENSVFIDPAVMDAVRASKPKPKPAGIKPSSLPAVAQPKKTEPAPPAARTEAPSKEAQIVQPALKPSMTDALKAEVEKRTNSKASPKAARVTPLNAPADVHAKPYAHEVKTSADLMADPQTRTLFTDYYGSLKGRIQHKLRENCAGREVGRGSIDLSFVLLADGRLHKVYVLDRSGPADPELKRLAIESLRAAAPFAEFPADFKTRQLGFNLTVWFDDL